MIPIAGWTFEDEGAGGWSLDQMIRGKCAVEGCVFRTTGIDPKLVRTVSVSAEKVDVFELEAIGINDAVEIFWAGPGEDFSPDRRVALRFGYPTPDVIRFKVGEHPLWRGKIRRLRIDPSNDDDHRFELKSLQAGHFDISRIRVKELASVAWKMALDDEVRPAYRLTPETPFKHPIEVREGDRLQVGYALQKGVQGKIRIEARLIDSEGTTEVLFSEAIGKGRSERYKWHDRQLEMSRSGRFSLEVGVRSDETSHPARGFVVWEAPRVLRREPEVPGLNVILVSVDTLRADHLSLYGYSRPTSRHLERWAAGRGVVFENVVAAAPWTLPAHVSMLTGMDALRHGINHDSGFSDLATVGGLLAKAGYSTSALTGGGLLHPKFGFHAGFDSYRYWPVKSMDHELEVGVDNLIGRLNRLRETRFFVFFHTYEVHSPYRPRQPFFDLFRGPLSLPFSGDIKLRGLDPLVEFDFRARDELEVRRPGLPPRPLERDEISLAIDLYDSGIAFMDTQIHRLLEYLDHSGLAEDTAVIITSDHGEAFGEHGLIGHQALYDENLMVPLVVIAPGVKAGHRVTEQVRSIDIAPTVLELAGLGGARLEDGVSLVKALHGLDAGVPQQAWAYAAKTNYGLALRSDGDLKYIFDNNAWSGRGGGEEIYDLRNDPEEQVDISRLSGKRAALRSLAVEEIRTNERGLRLEVHNRGRPSLKGSFVFSRDVSQLRFKVKNVGLTDGSLRRQGQRILLFDVPTGESLIFTVEGLDVPNLEILGDETYPPMRDLQVKISLTELLDRKVLLLHDGTWLEEQEPSELDSWIGVEWRNQRLMVEPVDATDPRLEEQLRVLGYVE